MTLGVWWVGGLGSLRLLGGRALLSLGGAGDGARPLWGTGGGWHLRLWPLRCGAQSCARTRSPRQSASRAREAVSLRLAFLAGAGLLVCAGCWGTAAASRWPMSDGSDAGAGRLPAAVAEDRPPGLLAGHRRSALRVCQGEKPELLQVADGFAFAVFRAVESDDGSVEDR